MSRFSYKLLFLFLLIWHASLCSSENNINFSSQSSVNTSLFQVGVVLDLDSLVGYMGLTSLNVAHRDFYSLHPNYTTRLVLNVRDSIGNTIDAASAALDLLKDIEVDAIIGPQKSAQANFMVDIGDRARVPIISFSATSPSLHPKAPYFVQTTQNDETQVGAIAAIIKAFMWKEVVLVCEDSAYGNDVVSYLANAFQAIDARIPYRSILPLSASDELISIELYKLMSMQTRVFVVHMSISLSSRFFLKAKELGMMNEGYVWIVTNGVMDLLYNMDSLVIEAMQGVLGVKPLIPASKELNSFTFRWKRQFLRGNPSVKHAEMSMFAIWAYDTLWALATAAEKVKHRESFKKEKTTNPFDFGTSQTGPKLLEAILQTSFKGLAGDFHLDNGQLRPSAFQIMNVVGKGEREVGVWTQSGGISRHFNANVSNSMSVSKDSFRKIIWPGESVLVPKGWEVPVSGKKLKIGVPLKKGFSEFVRVEVDPITKALQFKGLCIDIFDSVIKALPYDVPYEYLPYEISNGNGGGTYHGLVHQVYLQKFDAAVGDITITANRSSYVDFTLPFADGGINMIVPVTYEDNSDAWTFLKPLSKELWLTSIAFFILTGFAVWVLEHRINIEFRGPPSQHVPLILWFPFSMLVFAHRERIVSNLGKLVVTVWIVVILILSSSYTASLSSRLTVQRLQTSVTDVKVLIKEGAKVGYQSGSFVYDVLKGMGFDAKNLKGYESRDECHKDFIKDKENGGISAFFDVAAYNNIFISNYCPKYTASRTIYRTDGFAFVFPKASPIVGDISRTLIAITEGDKILEIEQQSFGNPTTCLVPESNISSNSLNLGSFIGLFSITGCVTGLCLVIYLIRYIYQNRDSLTGISPSYDCRSTWSKFRQLCKHFDQRDLSAYPFSRRSGEDLVKVLHFGDFSLTNDSHSISVTNSPPPQEMVAVDIVQNT